MRRINYQGKSTIAAIRVVLGVVIGLLIGSVVDARALELGRFQVVAGKDENSYLVDTTTGSVWVLTFRTLVTGREPIAIPFKFIKITPKDQNILVENTSQMAPVVDRGGDGEKSDGVK